MSPNQCFHAGIKPLLMIHGTTDSNERTKRKAPTPAARDPPKRAAQNNSHWTRPQWNHASNPHLTPAGRRAGPRGRYPERPNPHHPHQGIPGSHIPPHRAAPTPQAPSSCSEASPPVQPHQFPPVDDTWRPSPSEPNDDNNTTGSHGLAPISPPTTQSDDGFSSGTSVCASRRKAQAESVPLPIDSTRAVLMAMLMAATVAAAPV